MIEGVGHPRQYNLTIQEQVLLPLIAQHIGVLTLGILSTNISPSR